MLPGTQLEYARTRSAGDAACYKAGGNVETTLPRGILSHAGQCVRINNLSLFWMPLLLT